MLVTDEPQAPEVQDTPDTQEGGPPEEATPAPAEQHQQEAGQVDWEQRYKDLQATYTQTSQEAAQLRQAQEQAEAVQAMHSALQDPTTQQQAYQALTEQLGEDGAREWLEENGYEFDEDEQPPHDPRVDQLLAEREQEREFAANQQIANHIRSQLDGFAESQKVNLSDSGKAFILNYAVQQWDGEGDIPVEDAFKAYLSDREAAIRDYRDTKRNQPSPPVKGPSGTEANPPGQPRANRLALANQIAEEAEQSAR
jgi:hypothetical protein